MANLFIGLLLGFLIGFAIGSMVVMIQALRRVISRLNKELNKHIEDIIKKNFNSMREKYNTDIFNFRQSFYRGNPKYYNTHYKDTWYESIFPNLTLEVKSNIKLYEKGNTLGGIEYENKNN